MPSAACSVAIAAMLRVHITVDRGNTVAIRPRDAYAANATAETHVVVASTRWSN